MSEYREFWILESRCTGKKSAHKTQAEAWDEMQGNDNEIHVIEHKALMSEAEAHKQIAALLTRTTEALEAERRKCVKLVEVLNDTLNYLHWNTDNLCGDDLIGDKRLTTKFKARIASIEQALSNFQKGGGNEER